MKSRPTGPPGSWRPRLGSIEPDDEHRQAALDVGNKGDSSNPATWLALAAGWSGGFQPLGPTKQVPVPQYMTARAARIAVLTSAQKLAGSARQAVCRIALRKA